MPDLPFDAAVKLQPGDKVLLTAADDKYDVAWQWPKIRGQLAERFPGVEFTILVGISGIAVQPVGEVDHA